MFPVKPFLLLTSCIKMTCRSHDKRHIREGEVPKPSTKVTTLGVGAEAYARARRLPLGELQKQLRGELDDAVNRATGEALKEKARQLGEVQEISENAETGELIIRVKV